MGRGDDWLKGHVRDVADFPRPGVVFKDITPLLGDADAFHHCVDTLADNFAGRQIDKVLGVEARGFIIAAPIAYRFGAGFVPVRKLGKLPWQVQQQQYQLEYGADALEIHSDALAEGQQTLIIDDVLATGGTAAAAAQLVERLGGKVIGIGFIIELAFLGGRGKLAGHDAVSLIRYD